MWPPRRLHLELEDGDYEQHSDGEPKPPRRRNKARRGTNPFIDVKTGVDGRSIGDEGSGDENNDLDGFIVADDVEL